MTEMDLSRLVWRKGRRSGNGGEACVEVAPTTQRAVAVRDSKDADGPKLAFGPDSWAAFVSDVRNGRFDL